MRDDQGLAFVNEEAAGATREYPPFAMRNTGGLCHGDGPTVPSRLAFVAGGGKVSAATGEKATLVVDGRYYVPLTIKATDLVDFEASDVGSESSFIIAHIPKQETTH